MNDKNNLDKRLTVLLVFNRCPEYTFRWMIYHNQIHFPFRIVIADGGRNEIVSDVLSDYANFSNLDYSYLHYEEYGTNSEYFSRIYHALTEVRTPYVLKAANDDFFLVDGIRKTLSFLHKHPDYVSSRGEIYDFRVSGAPELRWNTVYGCITRFRQFNPQASILEETAIERIRNQCANYCSNWYDVYRTKDLKRYHRILDELNPSDVRFAGEITDFSVVAEGKVNRLGGLFMLHQANPIQGEGAVVLKQFPTYKEWMQTAGWQKDYDNLIQLMAESISSIDQIQLEEAKKQFAQIYHDEFLAPRIAEDKQNMRNRSESHHDSGHTGFLKKMLVDTVRKLEYDHPVRKASQHGYNLTKGLKRKIVPSYSEVKNSKYYESVKPIIKFLADPPKSLDNLSRCRKGLSPKKSYIKDINYDIDV